MKPSLQILPFVLALLFVPACALGRGPVGLPVTLVIENRPTGTETHEVDLKPHASSANFVTSGERRAERESRDFELRFAGRVSNPSNANLILLSR